MTHDDLVKKAAKWLRGQGCVVIITEMAGQTQQPDAIGFRHTHSILIECKANRSDFLSDKHKPFMRSNDSMGDLRYYFTPIGIIKIEELPDGWGLLEPHGKRIYKAREAEWQKEKSYSSEISLLVSTIRRIKGIEPEGVSIKCYFYTTDNRATLGIQEFPKEIS